MSLLCGLPFAAALFAACSADAPLAVGYVEGEFVRLAPIETAEVREIAVRRGDHVERGAVLARLEVSDAEIAVAQARAALRQAQAQLADLKLGKRPEEIAVLDAALRSAQAQSHDAARTLGRISELAGRGTATQADLDKARTAAELADAAVGQAKANLAVAALAARPEAIQAAENAVEQAQAALEQAEWRLTKRTIVAPVTGRISDVVRTAGDLSGPSAPVLTMLPEGAVKVKLYLPETSFSDVAVGDRLAVACDGCPAGLTATVSYASPEPEFTPPVIYSPDIRQKLVHLVEAKPDGEAAALKPGQIVDVRLP